MDTTRRDRYPAADPPQPRKGPRS